MTNHIAVMTEEVMKAIAPRADGRYLDATLGGGTHTEELLRRSAPSGRVLSLDLDLAALARGRERLAAYGKRFQCVEGNFRHLATLAREADFAPVDGIVIDLGLSSDELADPSRGFSFQLDGPLDMRLGPKANEDGTTAESLVNSLREAELAELIRTYGEERYAGYIAKAIVASRRIKRIRSTVELATIIVGAVSRGYERGRIHPATRTFQALRIAVNDELAVIREAISGAREILAPNGVLSIISFHSLEDRAAKQTIRSFPDLVPLTKKPLIPTDAEIQHNPRSRSAKLRSVRYLPNPSTPSDSAQERKRSSLSAAKRNRRDT